MTRRYQIIGALAAIVFATACSSRSASEEQRSEDKPRPTSDPPPMPAPLTLSSRPNARGGERFYLQKCAMCHSGNGMGAGLLARRAPEPLLERHTDLTGDYIFQAARMGIGNMPAIPPGEVSDAELKQIGDYLSKARQGAK